LSSEHAFTRETAANLASIVELICEDVEDSSFEKLVQRMMNIYHPGLAMCLPGNGQPFRLRWMQMLSDAVVERVIGPSKRRTLPRSELIALSRALWRRPNAICFFDEDVTATNRIVIAMQVILRRILASSAFNTRLQDSLSCCLEIVLAMCRRTCSGGAIESALSNPNLSESTLGLVKRADEIAFRKGFPCATKLQFSGRPPESQINVSPIAYNIVASLGGDQVGDLLEITDVG